MNTRLQDALAVVAILLAAGSVFVFDELSSQVVGAALAALGIFVLVTERRKSRA